MDTSWSISRQFDIEILSQKSVDKPNPRGKNAIDLTHITRRRFDFKNQ